MALSPVSGVPVTDVRYVASQPWPFPANIMLGFFARALSSEIRIDPEELDDARWFTAAELADFGEWADPHATFRHSRKDSISRYLVDTWAGRHR